MKLLSLQLVTTFCKSMFLLWQNTHNMKLAILIILECSVLWYEVHSSCVQPSPPSISITLFILKNRNSDPIKNDNSPWLLLAAPGNHHSSFFVSFFLFLNLPLCLTPQPLATTILLCYYEFRFLFFSLDSTYKWTHAIFVLLYLTCYTLRRVLGLLLGITTGRGVFSKYKSEYSDLLPTTVSIPASAKLAL